MGNVTLHLPWKPKETCSCGKQHFLVVLSRAQDLRGNLWLMNHRTGQMSKGKISCVITSPPWLVYQRAPGYKTPNNILLYQKLFLPPRTLLYINGTLVLPSCHSFLVLS